MTTEANKAMTHDEAIEWLKAASPEIKAKARAAMAAVDAEYAKRRAEEKRELAAQIGRAEEELTRMKRRLAEWKD
jgi:hypothetical protein